MAYTRVTRAAFGASAIDYAIVGMGHNGKTERNEVVTLINLCSEIPIETQMERYWNRARSNHKTQIVRIIQSFSKKELNPSNSSDIFKANEIGQAMVNKHYPHRQALVCTQTDGKGGCVHNHILICDVSMKDNKGCSKEQYYHPTLAKWTDEIASEYIILDDGEESDDKLTQSERVKREKNEYSYKDDIRKRVTDAMKKSTNEKDFIQKLSENGVSAIKKNSKKYGDYYTYELTDTSAIPEGAKLPNHALKARSYKLGTAYGSKALKEQIKLYERVGVRKEFTEINEEFEIDIIPKPTLAVKEKEEQCEVEETVNQTLCPVINTEENVHEDLRSVLTDIEEEEENQDVLSAINHTEKEQSTITKPKKKCIAKPKSKKRFQINKNRFELPLDGVVSETENDDDFDFK